MDIIVAHDEIAMGRETSRLATQALQQVISAQGEARLLVATGASQLTIFDSLCGNTDVDWSVVDAFHLDEYIGIDQQHSASFCRYLKERFVDRVPLRSFHYLRGDQEVATVMDAANQQILKAPIDLALVGIGENAHLAFNDPPAD
ncbi:MAG TPA: glucosamine-6-phosphate deaminase, partial [Planctomycetaceae bacterium]|nr:glucosamine-6-phosphate deaminase [Planctomycetaceae bacterium]